MISFDTNVLLRFIVRDDAEQLSRVLDLIEIVRDSDESILLTDMVLCEFAWTMRAAYKRSRIEIITALKSISNSTHLQFESSTRLDRAIRSYETGRGDFADYLIEERSLELGCRAVFTFDRALLKKPGFIEP